MKSVIINGSDHIYSSQLNIEFVNVLFKNLWYQSCLRMQILLFMNITTREFVYLAETI